MEWRGQVKPTYFDLPEDLRHAVKSEAALRRKTIRVAVQEALEAWLNPEKPAPDPDPDVEMLRRVKEIGKADAIKTLHELVAIFLKDAERERRKRGA